jgi:hypothetical protein
LWATSAIFKKIYPKLTITRIFAQSGHPVWKALHLTQDFVVSIPCPFFQLQSAKVHTSPADIGLPELQCDQIGLEKNLNAYKNAD